VTAFVDATVLVRHLTGEPAELASRATAFLYTTEALLLTDVVVAETVRVLETFYEAPRESIAQALRSLLTFDTVVCVDQSLLLRAVELYETAETDFGQAYLVACAESTAVDRVVSFDRSVDRATTVERIEPP
jgi:predicted nucleic-acid-binding protein